MEIQGQILVIGDTQVVGTNNFRKRQLVIETDEQYKQTIPVDFVQDKTELLNNFSVGQDVKVSINIRGNSWVNPQGETKYFAGLQGWRIEGIAPAVTPAQTPPPPVETPPVATEEEETDLPF